MQAPERRIRRSENSLEALHLFLEAVRERDELGAVAVATPDGLLVAGAGPANLDLLGAVGADTDDDVVAWQGEVGRVCRFEAAELPLVMTTTQGSPDPEVVRAGFARILARAA